MSLKKKLPYNNLSDKETIRRVLGGETYFYENIIRKYDQRLYRISMSIINNSEEAQDVLQAGYIKAYENLSKFQFKSDFGTWLIRIIINESLLHLRRKKRAAQSEKQEAKSSSSSESPLQKVINKEVTDILEKALVQLPTKYRIVFIMREIEDMTVKETMEALNISESNVKIRLNRAKEMLRNLLTKYYKTKDLYNFDDQRCDEVVKNVLVSINDIT